MSEHGMSLYNPALPESRKSGIRKFFESVTGGGETAVTLRRHGEAVGHLIRSDAESALVGGMLGAIHASVPQTGLDVVVKKAQGLGGTTSKETDSKGNLLPAKGAVTVPADLALGVAAGVLSLATAGSGVDGVSTDLRNVSSAAIAVFGFRKGADVVAAKRRAANMAPGGQVPSLVSLQREATAKATVHGEGPAFGYEPANDPIIQAGRALAAKKSA